MTDLIREDPRKSVADFLRGAPGKRQQRDVARLLDGQGQTPLVRRADSGQAPRNDLAALRHELRQQPDVLVVDGLDFLHAEFANLLAAKIFAPTFAAATRAAGTRRTAFRDRQTKAGRRMDDLRPPDAPQPELATAVALISSAMMLLKISRRSVSLQSSARQASVVLLND